MCHWKSSIRFVMNKIGSLWIKMARLQHCRRGIWRWNSLKSARNTPTISPDPSRQKYNVWATRKHWWLWSRSLKRTYWIWETNIGTRKKDWRHWKMLWLKRRSRRRFRKWKIIFNFSLRRRKRSKYATLSRLTSTNSLVKTRGLPMTLKSIYRW